jgi:hypothetical protein
MNEPRTAEAKKSNSKYKDSRIHQKIKLIKEKEKKTQV